MKPNDINFARQLVKGKIVETIFAQMLRSTGKFTVLEFGYENIVPEIVGAGFKEDNDALEVLRSSPDFAVINKTKSEVHLIEVKYRKTFSKGDVLRIAKRMGKSWNPSYLFLATPDGFYFGEVKKIIENKGAIEAMSHPQIPKATQEAYLKILNEFEG